MSDIRCIQPFNALDELTPEQQDDVHRIFFESSSRKNFISADEANEFFKKWTDYYFESDFPGENFIYLGVQKNVLGYISGTEDSERAGSFFNRLNPCYNLFSHQFKKYPAHFHINVDEKARGQKIGSLLINAYINHLREKGIKGIHLITSPNADNVHFYKRNHFTHTEEQLCKNTPQLFMGRLI